MYNKIIFLNRGMASALMTLYNDKEILIPDIFMNDGALAIRNGNASSTRLIENKYNITKKNNVE